MYKAIETMSDGRDATGNLDYKLMLALRNIERLPSSKKQALLAELDNMSPSYDGFLQERQRKIDFAVDLGYPQQKVEAALRSLGPDASVDQLLKRLASGLSGPYTTHERAKPLNEERESTVSVQAAVQDSSQLRPIVVDGSNVAMKHGNGRVFSCKGILLVVEYFRNRGMSDKDITVFVPQWRKEPSKPESPITDQDVLFRLEREGVVVFTPSKKMQGRRIVCYDDRFIVKRAADTGGVIVSNDAFRDLLSENEEWRETIEKRVLMFCFANDVFMVPQDPLGRYGPPLEEMLQFSIKSSPVKAPANEKRGGQVTCPYGERCTFGSKCRFYHPERGDSSNKTRSRSTTPTPLHARTGSSTEDLYVNQKDADHLTDKMRALQFHSSPQPTDIHAQMPSDYRCYSDSNVSHIPDRPHSSQRHPYTFPLAQVPKHHSRPNDTSDKSSNYLFPEKKPVENSPYLSRDVPDVQRCEMPNLRHEAYAHAVPHPQYNIHQDVLTFQGQMYRPHHQTVNYVQQCHSPVQPYQSPAMGHQSYQYHHQPMLHSSSPSHHHSSGASGREAFAPGLQNYRHYDRLQSKRQHDETQFRVHH